MPRAEEYYDYEEAVEPRKKDHLFLWTIFILLLAGAAFASWLGSAYVFGHPEEPKCYEILKKMGKIEAPRRFDVTKAPQGEFLTAERIFERYASKKPLELKKENAELLRIFIRNYSETKKVLPYLRGKFDVIETVKLTPQDIFAEGAVSLMVSPDYPQVVVEHLFPCKGPNVEQSLRVLAPGNPFRIEKTNDVTTVMGIKHIPDGRILITVVPIDYPMKGLAGGVGTFACEPPSDVNVAAGLPVTKDARLDEVLKRYRKMKSEQPLEDDAPSSALAKGPEVVRLDTVPMGEDAPATGALPEPTVARAEPVRPLAGTPSTRPAPTPSIGDLAMNDTRPATPRPVVRDATPRPLASTPAPIASTVPVATPVPAMPEPPPGATPSGVPLKPFNSKPAVVVQTNPSVVPRGESGSSWRVYSAGTQPRGRNVSPAEAAALVDQPIGGEKVYLSGRFIVRAKGDYNAVLRPQGMEQTMRIIVDFPDSAIPPEEGEVVARGADRAFEIRSVTRTDDGGTINVYAREITRN